ncbi:hypothetical protein PF004_g31089, partial [Phytophthora fragariae]
KLPRHPKLPTTCTTKTTVVKNGPESRPSSKPVSVSKCHRFKMLKKIAAALVVLGLTASPEANAGLLAYGICQTGCNALAVACYTAAAALQLAWHRRRSWWTLQNLARTPNKRTLGGQANKPVKACEWIRLPKHRDGAAMARR